MLHFLPQHINFLTLNVFLLVLPPPSAAQPPPTPKLALSIIDGYRFGPSGVSFCHTLAPGKNWYRGAAARRCPDPKRIAKSTVNISYFTLFSSPSCKKHSKYKLFFTFTSHSCKRHSKYKLFCTFYLSKLQKTQYI